MHIIRKTTSGKFLQDIAGHYELHLNSCLFEEQVSNPYEFKQCGNRALHHMLSTYNYDEMMTTLYEVLRGIALKIIVAISEHKQTICVILDVVATVRCFDKNIICIF